jgi:PEP-CTERM motif
MIRYGIVLALGAVVCSAATITYDVNQSVGSGTVTGTIETDGTLGVIPANTYLTSPTANIFLNWNLTLNDGTDPSVDFTPSNSELIVGGADLSATSNALLFNFGNSDSGFFLFGSSASETLEQWCGSSAMNCTQNPSFPNSGSDLQIGSNEQFTASSASAAIACIAAGCTAAAAGDGDPLGAPTPSSAPEPSTVSFLGLGFAALGFWKYRVKRS